MREPHDVAARGADATCVNLVLHVDCEMLPTMRVLGGVRRRGLRETAILLAAGVVVPVGRELPVSGLDGNGAVVAHEHGRGREPLEG